MSKRILTVAAALAACVLVGQGAQAKTLEDILKEKGVITEADYKEVTKSKPIDYKLGKGFTFTSADEKFQLSMGGRASIRYTYLDRDLSGIDSSQFSLKTGQIWWTGYAFTKNLEYNVRINVGAFSNSTSSKALETAYVKYKILDEIQILAGQNKTPFSRQNLVGVGGQELVDTSIVTTAFAPGYDLGAALTGKLIGGIVNYDLYVSNGAGATTAKTTNSANDMAFLARVELHPFGNMGYTEADPEYNVKPKLAVGANYYRNTLKKSAAGTFETNNLGYADTSNGWLGTANNAGYFNASEKVDIDMFNADIAFKWMGAFAQAEYFWGQGDGQVTNNKVVAQGYYIQGGYCVIPKKLELAMRWSYLDPNRGRANDTKTELIGGVSYYFNNHNLKLQADIGNIHTQTGATTRTDDMQYRVQTVLVF